uniref:Uncharacterized protein n=1 Tax=Arundo donax TaxID=35708 RepID=A0A0A9H1Y4_ARUDO
MSAHEIQQWSSPWPCSSAGTLLGLPHKFLHRAGEQLPPPVPRRALAGWWPHQVMAEWHRLLHMGGDQLQSRQDSHRCLLGF